MQPSRTAPKSSRRGNPSESRADGNDGVKRKVIRLANLGGSGAEGDRLGWVPGALRAAFAEEGGRYCRDARRRDLLELWSEALGAIRRHDQRWRCVEVTW
jgi:hypothetical protein